MNEKWLLTAASVTVAMAKGCTFCALDATGKAHSFDLSSLPKTSFQAFPEEYNVAMPCAYSNTPRCGIQPDPFLQSCKGVGTLKGASVTTVLTDTGINVTLGNGFDDPPMPHGRNAVYQFVCDKSAPVDNGPEPNVTEHPPGFYNVLWKHPSVCNVTTPSQCEPLPSPAPTPSPTPCVGSGPCLPTWKPTWDMKNSTVLYTCNNTGMHNVTHANQFGIVVYDWSNAKAIWANAHPMSSEELITKQAEMVYAQDPGVAGYAPRVWAYRNTIKALNWYSSVREKLDDPKYASWFIKFKGFSNTTYPGGHGRDVNGSFHVPNCDWYDNGTAPRCSGFYHDQEQTPNHPGGGPAYRVDGECMEQCDCGGTNPCGEYIFDHRGGEVEGRTFQEWFINEYMITNETLYHRDPVTGKPQQIGLGWLDDSMRIYGPTEEDKNYIADTGADQDEMKAQVAAYQESMTKLKEKLIPMGGFYWQLMDGGGIQLNQDDGSQLPSDTCQARLRTMCVAQSPKWDRMQMYNVPSGGQNLKPSNFTDYTAEFLLTRGPYALLGYSWCGCTNGAELRPRAAEWDEDFGEPLDVCQETSANSGVFERKWSKATVQWDCHTGHGSIQR